MIDVSDDANVADVWLIQLQFLEFLRRYERHFRFLSIDVVYKEESMKKPGRSTHETAPKTTDEFLCEVQTSRPNRVSRPEIKQS